jgi:integrase
VNLTPESIDSALHGIGPASRNLKIRHLKSVLNFCMKHDWLKDSPLRRVDLAPIQRREIQTYTPEQVRSIMLAVKQLYPEAVPFFAICFFAGTRPEEVLRLDWNAISDREHICVPAEVSKTRSRRFTTISPTLLAWLNWHEQNGGPTEGRIFPKSEMTLIRMRRNVAKSAQVKWIQDGARKTFASAHFKTFMDAGKTAYELGHRGTSMLHTHYNQNMRKEDAEQFWKIVPPL